MSNPEVREAIPIDAAALGSLHVACWRETYTGLLPDDMLAELSAERRAAMWSRILGNPDAPHGTVAYVAEEDGRLVGFASCGPQRDAALLDAGYDGEISAIYVARSHQKRGIGRLLMAAMARTMSGRKVAATSLWVLRENAAARAFYEGLGGEVVGQKREEVAAATLVDVAYGWRDVSRLLP